MPKVFKKIVLSLLIFTTLFLSVAPNFVYADSTTTITGSSTGTATTTSSSSQTSDSSSQASWYMPGPINFYQKVFDSTNPSEIFGERYTYAQVVWILYSLPMAIFGIDATTWQEAYQLFTTGNVTSMNSLLDKNSKLAQMKDPFMTIINQFYLSPPASGMYWLHQEANNFSITKTAYAAAPTNSFGYSSLAIFQPI